MKIETREFGLIEIDETDIINFPNGITGFEEYKKFIILSDESGIFSVLQSVEEINLSFVLLEPLRFLGDYEVRIDDDLLLESIKTTTIDDLRIYTTVAVGGDPTKMTTNLIAPVLLNKKLQIAAQFILNDLNNDLVRYPIYEAISASVKGDTSC